MTPQPWPRTGPGSAKDGKPKFDLDAFDQAYFDRLRERVIAAGDAGIYVAVMLFDGWASTSARAPDNVEGHPFHAANNVNGIGITSIVDYQVLPLDPRVQAHPGGVHPQGRRHRPRPAQRPLRGRERIVGRRDRRSRSSPRRSGLREAPEWGDSTEWQYWVIDVVKRYEQRDGLRRSTRSG